MTPSVSVMLQQYLNLNEKQSMIGSTTKINMFGEEDIGLNFSEHFEDDEYSDSFNSLIWAVEESFNIKIEDDEQSGIVTVHDLYELIISKVTPETASELK
jgi:acyl carrier protein